MQGNSKSKWLPVLGRSAGDKLMMIRSWGLVYPLFTSDRPTRCVLSLTAASASPTSIVLGIAAGEMSTSTSTGFASIPSNENVKSFESICESTEYKSSGNVLECESHDGVDARQAAEAFCTWIDTSMPKLTQPVMLVGDGVGRRIHRSVQRKNRGERPMAQELYESK